MRLTGLIKALYHSKLIRYLCTGGAAFVLDVAIFSFLVYVAGMKQTVVLFHFNLPNIISLSVGFLFSFLVNKFWSFGAKTQAARQFLMSLALFAVNTAYTSFFIHYAGTNWGLPELWAKILISCIMVVLNFLVFNRLIFRAGTKSKG